LVYAAYAGRSEAILLLIAHGAKLDLAPKIGPTALNAAVLSGNVDAVKVLLQAGASVTQKDVKGYSAIEIAERAGHAEMVLLLQAKEKLAR
jgi:uncharacterized protein